VTVERLGVIVAAVVLIFALVLVLGALGAVFLMVGLALVHRDLPAVPALGFAACFGVDLVLGAIAASFKNVSSS
jgi:hypothetical protein